MKFDKWLLKELFHAIERKHKHHKEIYVAKGTFTVTFTVEAAPPPPIEVAPTEDLGQVGGPLAATQLIITGGTPPYTVSLDSASAPLPPGITVNSDGTFSGVPTEAGSFAVTFDVADSLG